MSKKNRKGAKAAIGSTASDKINIRQSAPDNRSPVSPQRRKYILAVATGLLLTIGVVGAVTTFVAPRSTIKGENASGSQSSSWLPRIFPVSQPSPIPTPILEKQHIFAGGKLVAVELAGANPTTSVQASDLVVWRKVSGSWYVRDAQNPENPILAMQFGVWRARLSPSAN